MACSSFQDVASPVSSSRFGFQMKMGQLILSVISAMVFACYMVYDTQMILGSWGGHKLEFEVDDYIFAALNLYLDIVNFFLDMLTILGSRD